ncbi:MAG: replication-associated recombination protein A [Actinobacteria bacterium]|nr:replication-associated recombination protein A [Actinomycetota bacterium]MCL6105085.1 replication-associated recombination protein A [Actinomycetota bacterium]
MEKTELFDYQAEQLLKRKAPLASQLRPATLADMVGQQHLISPGALLRSLIENDKLASTILWGPPGSGKTTLAKVIANETSKKFISLVATSSGVKEVREAVEDAKARLGAYSQGTILFIDEVHRFNKAQQDVLLPDIESGLITLVAATTENPFFSLIAPLMSRSTLFRLEPLSKHEILVLLHRGLRALGCTANSEALDIITSFSNGDARRALTILEMSWALATSQALQLPQSKPVVNITPHQVSEATAQRSFRYGLDEHYDMASALIKSIRGSDSNAGIYWLARILAGGGDPRFIARRLVILASEDIGMADPLALGIAVAGSNAVEFVGMPEAALNLAQVVVYLSKAPKSNSVAKAIWDAQATVADNPPEDVPMHLRDSHYKGASKLGHGVGYIYPHDDPRGWTEQQYMPDKT